MNKKAKYKGIHIICDSIYVKYKSRPTYPVPVALQVVVTGRECDEGGIALFPNPVTGYMASVYQFTK